MSLRLYCSTIKWQFIDIHKLTLGHSFWNLCWSLGLQTSFKLFILSTKSLVLWYWCWCYLLFVFVSFDVFIFVFAVHFHRLVYLYLYSVEVDIDNGDGWKAALVTWSDRVGGWSATSAANNTTWQLFETTFAKKCWIRGAFLQIVCQLQAHSVKGHCKGTVFQCFVTDLNVSQPLLSPTNQKRE